MFRRSVAVTATILLAGCATPLPVAENFPLSSQKKLRSAQHWNLIAGDVAQQTAAILRERPEFREQPLSVANPEQSSAFKKAFGGFITTRLVDMGLRVVKSKPGALRVDYETQVVIHNSERPSYRPGTLTALTAGLYVVHGMFTRWSVGEAMLGGLGLAGAEDVRRGQETGGPTHAEIVVTTSITHDDAYVMRKTDVYYVEDADVDLFRDTALPTPPQSSHAWKVVGE